MLFASIHRLQCFKKGQKESMGKITGFKEFERKTAPYRDVTVRLKDFGEIYTEHDEQHLITQGARCMDCGIPF